MSAAGLGKVLLEAVGDGEDDHFPDEGALGAELVYGFSSEGGNLLRELLEGGHIMGKTAGNTDGLLRLDHVLELHARDTPQFLPGPETREVEKCSDRGLRELHEVPGRHDAHLRELSHGAPADAPDILGGEPPQDLLDVLRAVHVASAAKLGVLLAELGGYLREGLRRGDADGDGDGGLTPAVPGDPLCQGIEIRPLHPGKVQEALVNGVGLDGGGVAPKDLLDPPGHIPVEGEVGTEDGNPVLLDKGP